MAINWYPGHMNKARKEIAEAMPEVDLVIEILDARLPYSSSNPMINQLRQNKPVLKVMNKSDLADSAKTEEWVNYFNSQNETLAIAINSQNKQAVQDIARFAKQLFPHREENKKNIRAMIMGIPNVGKSTIINILAGKIVAKTGNEPAVTKRQQHIDLKNGIKLSDTPGILWPKIHNQNSAYRLATSGAIKDTALEYDDIGLWAIEFFIHQYPTKLKERFKLDELNPIPMEALSQIGSKRGCLKAGGKLDLHRTCEIFIHEIRAGKLGPITLETPAEMEKEEAELKEQFEAERAEKEARKRKSNR